LTTVLIDKSGIELVATEGTDTTEDLLEVAETQYSRYSMLAWMFGLAACHHDDGARLVSCTQLVRALQAAKVLTVFYADVGKVADEHPWYDRSLKWSVADDAIASNATVAAIAAASRTRYPGNHRCGRTCHPTSDQ